MLCASPSLTAYPFDVETEEFVPAEIAIQRSSGCSPSKKANVSVAPSDKPAASVTEVLSVVV
jgi:hypothetical protein